MTTFKCYCVCKKELEMLLSNPYKPGLRVCCDSCYKRIDSDEVLFHCSSSIHQNGYDLCWKCSHITQSDKNSLNKSQIQDEKQKDSKHGTKSQQEIINELKKNNANSIFDFNQLHEDLNTYSSILLSDFNHHQFINVYKSKCNKSTEDQIRLICVISRIVQSHNNWYPRITQIIPTLLIMRYRYKHGLLFQINTGEGKSIAVVIMSTFISLTYNETTDIVSSSATLSKRESEEQKNIYKTLSIKCSCLSRDEDTKKREKKYSNNLTTLYTTMSTFQWDILDDDINTNSRKQENLICDEVDNLMIDEIETQSLISSPVPGVNYCDSIMLTIFNQVKLSLKSINLRYDGSNYYCSEATQNFWQYIYKFINNNDEKEEKQTALHLPKCVNNHQMSRYAMQYVTNYNKCNKCTMPKMKTTKYIYKCNSCNYNICIKCAEQYKNESILFDLLDYKFELIAYEYEHLSALLDKNQGFSKWKNALSIDPEGILLLLSDQDMLHMEFKLYQQGSNGLLHCIKTIRTGTYVENDQDTNYIHGILVDEDNNNISFLTPVDIHNFDVELKKNIRITIDTLIKKSDASKHVINEASHPAFMKKFIALHLDLWIDSALRALVYYKENHHYIIKNNEIVIVDFNNTGELQQKRKWGDGLHSFLELKHHLKMNHASMTTTFMTNSLYFGLYTKIYGLTGTLGDKITQNYLKRQFNLEIVIIPTFKHKIFIQNKPISRLNERYWLQDITNNTIHKIKQNRAVLVICKTIAKANKIKEAIEQYKDNNL